MCILSYHSVFTAISSISGIHGCQVRVKRGSSTYLLHTPEQVCFLFLWFMLCWQTGLSFVRKHASTMRHSSESTQGGQLLAYFWLLFLLNHQVKKSSSILCLIWTSNRNWRKSLGHSECNVQSHNTSWWGYVLGTAIRQGHCMWAPSSILHGLTSYRWIIESLMQHWNFTKWGCCWHNTAIAFIKVERVPLK